MSDPWATPGATAPPRVHTRLESGAASVQPGWTEWTDGRVTAAGQSQVARWTARGLACVALAVGVGAYVLGLVGIITFLGGGFLLVALAMLVAVLSFAVALSALIALGIAVRAGQRTGAVLTAVIALVAVAPGALYIDGILWAEDREQRKDRVRAQALPRPLPASATPEQVVEFVRQLEEGEERELGAHRDALCGLLVPRVRRECYVNPPLLYDKVPYKRERDAADRVILSWPDRLQQPVTVRLERSSRGWELVDVPQEFADNDCVRQALDRNGDPWACPPQ